LTVTATCSQGGGPAVGNPARFLILGSASRDLPALGISIPPQSLRRCWMMLAHYHGQLLNLSELGRSCGAADTTVRGYLADNIEALGLADLVQESKPR
jgi:predicted AAA+ superfamily ATPase